MKNSFPIFWAIVVVFGVKFEKSFNQGPKK
jgi:hypothetical protein